MASSSRGLRVLKTINMYAQRSPENFDVHNLFNKINITSLSAGVMKGSFTVDVSMCNGANTLHGGYIASALDTFSLCAYLSMPEGKLLWTSNLNINYIKSSKIGDKVNVEAVVLKTGQNPIMEAVMKDESGELLAKSVTAFSVGNELHQKLLKDSYDFDVCENSNKLIE